jgi:adenosylcobinamide-GDP ribazoletransferase
MKSFISAIQFITILPVGKPGAFEPKGMIQFFPVVGIIIGLLVAAFDIAVLQLWPEPVASLLDVIFLAIITGAFHLDGLADTADGLLGHRTREQALAIMKDSRIGVMGLVAVVCALAIKWAGIASLDVRPEGGTGHDLFSDSLKISAFWGLLIPVALSFFLGWRGVLLNLTFIIVTALILLYYKKRIGCITGDMLGAMTEVIESMLFLMVSITISFL